MAYSRWSNSDWYTFWVWMGGDDGTKPDDEWFDVCNVRSFSYRMLKDDIDDCIERVKDAVNQSDYAPEYKERLLTQESLDELRGYMHQFIADVEEEYKNREKDK